MYAPLTRSDYYGASATPGIVSRRRALPSSWLAASRERRCQNASHVHHHPVGERAAQLYPGSIATPTPQAFNVASPPASKDRLRSRRPEAACAAPGPHPPGWSRWNTYGASGTGSSRTASRLACRTRAVWKCRHVPSLSGLLPPPRASPRISCPQLHQPAATGRRQGSFTPARLNSGASWRTSAVFHSHCRGPCRSRPGQEPPELRLIHTTGDPRSPKTCLKFTDHPARAL